MFGSGCVLKYFLFENTSKYFFYFFNISTSKRLKIFKKNHVFVKQRLEWFPKHYLSFLPLTKFVQLLRSVWDCSSGSKYFSFRNASKWSFFLFFKNYFWHQHIKIIWKQKKNILSKEKNLKLLETQFTSYSQTLSFVI